MNINKDNYEEYFLLFADNELSEEERLMVQDFVKQNAHLEEEFINLKLSVLKPENDLKLEDKSLLFRQTKKFVNHSNYAEAFLLYNDNELTNIERKETEAFLSENPSLQNEFDLLQKAKLQAEESIVFPGKKLLYKKDGSGKVVPFKWWKAVAAAVLLGIGIWTGVDYLKEKGNEIPVSVKKDNSKKLFTPIPIDTTSAEQVNVIEQNKPEKQSANVKSLLHKNINKLPSKALYVNSHNVIKSKRQTNNSPDLKDLSNKISKEESAIVIQEAPANNKESAVKESDETHKKAIPQDEIANSNKNEVPGAIAASYTSDESGSSNNYAFYNITEEKFNKSKVGGFLRKVKRVIGRKISPLNNSKDQREMTAE